MEGLLGELEKGGLSRSEVVPLTRKLGNFKFCFIFAKSHFEPLRGTDKNICTQLLGIMVFQ